MSISCTQLRELTNEILHKLQPLVPYSKDAEELLLLTAAQESHLGGYIKQVEGPALGIFQMEPRTDQDIHENFLPHNPPLLSRVCDFIPKGFGRIEGLQWDLGYQIVMARMQYWRQSEPLPPYKEVERMAQYWKKWYNTEAGKGTVEEAVSNYKKFVK